jgi:ureidoacrylate peracid hydrolase
VHRIAIDPAVLERVRTRRGPLGRPPDLVGVKTALLVIDLQNIFLLPGMPCEVPIAREILPNVNRLASAVRGAGGIVVWIQMVADPDPSSWSVYHAMRDQAKQAAITTMLQPGHAAQALHAELQVEPGDLLVEKRRYSAFIQGSSDVDAQLRARGVDTVVVAGTLTNVCCESTARDAMMLNYRVVFVSDANAARDDATHNATLGNILSTFGEVLTTDEVVDLLP